MLALSKHRFVQTLMIVVFVTIILNPVWAISTHDAAGDVTVAWEKGDDQVQWHEVRVRWRDLELKYELVTAIMKVDIPQLEATISKPRSGHWAVEVRACASNKAKCVDGKIVWELDENGNIFFCSPWVKSDVVGKPSPWEIYWKPPKPTALSVEEE